MISHCFPSGNSPPKYARINEHLNQSSAPSNNDEKREGSQDGKNDVRLGVSAKSREGLVDFTFK